MMHDNTPKKCGGVSGSAAANIVIDLTQGMKIILYLLLSVNLSQIKYYIYHYFSVSYAIFHY